MNTMKPTKLFLFLAVAVLLGACVNKSNKTHCRIEGTVPDSTYTMMLLAPSGSDFRVADADSIPVVDGKFAFDLYVDEVLPYDIISMEIPPRILLLVYHNTSFQPLS